MTIRPNLFPRGAAPESKHHFLEKRVLGAEVPPEREAAGEGEPHQSGGKGDGTERPRPRATPEGTGAGPYPTPRED